MTSISSIRARPWAGVAIALLMGAIAYFAISQVSSAKPTSKQRSHRGARAHAAFSSLATPQSDADALPATASQLLNSLNGQYGVRVDSASLVNSPSADVPVWVATGSGNVCLLAVYTKDGGTTAFQCGSTADAASGKLWTQRIDGHTGAASQIGFVPDGTSVSVDGTPKPVNGNTYNVTASPGSSIAIVTSNGTQRVSIPLKP